MKRYMVTCQTGDGCKVAGAYDYPEAMDVRRFWLGFCKYANLQLVSIEAIT